MQLQNAYKQCEIYRREISNLKKKDHLYNEQKTDDLQNQVAEMQKEREEFLREIKDLKKTIRQQEKGLMEVSGANLPKILQENDHLKEENRKLLEKKQKEELEASLSKVAQNNEKRKEKQKIMKTEEDKKQNLVREESQL